MSDLTEPGGKVRLYVEAPLGEGARVEPSPPQAHYLLHVMRAREGDRVSLFNGHDGEWLARLVEVTKRACALACERRTQEQSDTPDLWLCFAPIKKTPADYVVQKATELGVRALQPVITRRTIVARVNLERVRANAIEAAEQSGRLTIPEIREPLALEKMLSTWPDNRRLVFCDEAGDAPPIAEALMMHLPPPLAGGGKFERVSAKNLGEGGGDGSPSPKPHSLRELGSPPPARGGRSDQIEAGDYARVSTPFSILTGPEGGFDPAERDAIRACAFVAPVSLGPRILRADTAALAALAIWQGLRGDWR
jgi:16S rRNA (uracil1498-N3)-methyltransferase